MRIRLRLALVSCVVAACLAAGATAAHAGPVLVAGIDVEDGGVDAHGATSTWAALFNRFRARVTSGRSGLLVVGGGKGPPGFDDVTEYWNAIGQMLDEPVTYVNGGAIANANFSRFAMIAVASSEPQTEHGGLTEAENNVLAGRRGGIARAVNRGSALLAFSQTGLSRPYRYLSRLGNFDVNLSADYSDLTATSAGRSLGITNTNLDINAWHDEYVAFPSFLRVLARSATTGEAAVLGGGSVVIDERRPASRANPPACSATGRVRIRVRDRGGAGPRRVLYRIDGGRLRRKRTNNAAGARRGSAVVRVPNGRHTLRFRAVDRAGNRERRANRVSLRVDRVNRCAARLTPRFTG